MMAMTNTASAAPTIQMIFFRLPFSAMMGRMIARGLPRLNQEIVTDPFRACLCKRRAIDSNGIAEAVTAAFKLMPPASGAMPGDAPQVVEFLRS